MITTSILLLLMEMMKQRIKLKYMGDSFLSIHMCRWAAFFFPVVQVYVKFRSPHPKHAFIMVYYYVRVRQAATILKTISFSPNERNKHRFYEERMLSVRIVVVLSKTLFSLWRLFRNGAIKYCLFFHTFVTPII